MRKVDFGKIFNIAIMDFEHPKWESEQSIEPCKYNDFARLFEGWSAAAQGVIEVIPHAPLLEEQSLTQSVAS